MDATLEFMVWGLLAFRKLRNLGSQSQTLLQYGTGLCWHLWWRLPWRQTLPLSRQCCATLSKSHCPLSTYIRAYSFFSDPLRISLSNLWPLIVESQPLSLRCPVVSCLCLELYSCEAVTYSIPVSYSLGNSRSHVHSTLYWIKHFQMLCITYWLILWNVPVKIVPFL